MRERNTKLPRNAYYRCIWLVRDTERLISIADIKDHDDGAEHAEAVFLPDGKTVSDAAVERAKRELACIDAALCMLPEEMRDGVLANIIYRTPFSDAAHPNTWKKWKQKFIEELAKKLSII